MCQHNATTFAPHPVIPDNLRSERRDAEVAPTREAEGKLTKTSADRRVEATDARVAIRRGVFRSVKDLNAKIRAFIDGWNDQAHPFTWTKTPDEILVKTRRPTTSIRCTSGSEGARSALRGQSSAFSLWHGKPSINRAVGGARKLNTFGVEK